MRYYNVIADGTTLRIEGNTEANGLSTDVFSQEGKYYGAMADGIVYFYDADQVGDADFYDTWAAVDSAVYVEYAATAFEQNKCYYAALSLRVALEEAYAANEGIDLSELLAVYNNTESSVAELAAAEEAIAEQVAAYQLENVSVDNPADLTATALVNPSFATGDDTGWEGGPAVSSSYLNAEFWNKNFDLYQDVTALSEGVYRLDVQGFYGAGWPAEEYAYYIADSTLYNYAKLYATSSTLGTMQKSLVREAAERQADWTSTGSTQMADGTYQPNSMQGAMYFFDAGLYNNTLYVGLAEGDTLRVGIKKETLMSADWTIFDNFQLHYYGSSDEAYRLWGSETAAMATVYDLSTTYHSGEALEAYEALVATLASSSDKDEIIAAASALGTAEDELLLSITNYAAWLSLCEEIEQWLNDGEEQGMSMDIDAVLILSDYLTATVEDNEASVEVWGYPHGVANAIVNREEGEYAGTLSAEEIAEEYDYLYELYQYAMKNALVEGASLTSLLTNFDFEDSAAGGWSVDTNYSTPGFYVSGSYNSNHMAESWNTNFDTYQTVTDLPNGLYAVSVQAFYTTTTAAAAWSNYLSDPEMTGDAKVHTYVYFNEFATPVKNAAEIQFEENYGDDCYQPESGIYLVNTLTSAQAIFELEDESKNFTQTVYGLVSDGTMTLGLRNLTGTLYSRWSVWDNFAITYMGKNAAALYSVLEEFIERADTYDGQTYGDPEAEALTEALVVAVDALAAVDADAMYDALSALVAAINAAEEGVQAYADLAEAIEDLYDAINEYEDTTDPDVLEASVLLLEDVEEAGTTLSTNEVLELIDQINEMILSLQIPYSADASDDNPIDFTSVIENPTFDTIGDFSGWDADGSSSFGAGGTTSTCAERWQMNFDTYQDLTGLPEGTYEVRAIGFYETGTAAADYADWLAYKDADEDPTRICYLYATSTEGTASTAFEHICALGQPDNSVCSTNASGDEDNPCYVPATMAEADIYLHDLDDDGIYQMSIFINVGADGNLRIGVTKQEETVRSGCWMLVDDFELIYYGTQSAHLQDTDEGAVSIANVDGRSSQHVQAIYTLDGRQISAFQSGVNIVRTIDSEGRVSVLKVMMP